MNYIVEAENVLKKYKLMQSSIKNIKAEMDSIERGMRPSSKVVATLEETGVRGSKKNNDLFRYAELKAMREETQDYLDRIDCILADISLEKNCGIYGQLLKLWYIEKLSKEKIMEEFHYSGYQAIYEYRNKAIEAFAVALYGIRAVKAT